MKKYSESAAFMLEMHKIGIEVSLWDANSEIICETMRDIVKKHSAEKAKKWYNDLQLLRAGIIKEKDMEDIN